MEPEIIKKWEARKWELEAFFKTCTREWLDCVAYEGLFKEVQKRIFNLHSDDLETTQVLYFGQYQGDVAIVWQDSYQIYATCISYGSCSGCDVLENLRADYGTSFALFDEDDADNGSPLAPVPEEGVATLMGICLNMIQKTKRLN